VFKQAAEPVYAWFAENIEDGEKWLSLLQDEAGKAQEANEADYALDVN